MAGTNKRKKGKKITPYELWPARPSNCVFLDYLLYKTKPYEFSETSKATAVFSAF